MAYVLKKNSQSELYLQKYEPDEGGYKPVFEVGNCDTEVAAGLVDGRRIYNIYGRNFDVDSGTVPEDLWNGGGVYTGFPTTGSAETLSIVSSSVNDTSAGTGALTIKIYGLDGNYAEITETVTLNGTTPVTTTQTFWRVDTAEVIAAGSGGFNAGQITANHSTTTANVFFVMPANRGRTNTANFTVPAGWSALIRELDVWVRGSGTAQADGELWVRPYGQSAQLRHPWTASNSTPFHVGLHGGILCAEKTDIMVRVTAASATNMDIVSSYDIHLVRNS